jgi:hypothetical protein
MHVFLLGRVGSGIRILLSRGGQSDGSLAKKPAKSPRIAETRNASPD